MECHVVHVVSDCTCKFQLLIHSWWFESKKISIHILSCRNIPCSQRFNQIHFVVRVGGIWDVASWLHLKVRNDTTNTFFFVSFSKFGTYSFEQDTVHKRVKRCENKIFSNSSNSIKKLVPMVGGPLWKKMYGIVLTSMLASDIKFTSHTKN